MYQNQSGKARSVVSAGLCICIACICTVQKRVDALELTSSEPGDSWSSTTVKAEPTSPLCKATGDEFGARRLMVFYDGEGGAYESFA